MTAISNRKLDPPHIPNLDYDSQRGMISKIFSVEVSNYIWWKVKEEGFKIYFIIDAKEFLAASFLA